MSSIAQIKQIIAQEPELSRGKLSREVCQLLDWRDAKGRLKAMSCRKALNQLNQQGFIELPPVSQEWSFHRQAQKRSEPTLEFPEVSCSLQELGPLELIVVGNRQTKTARIWNELMERHHYLGKGPLCGAQLRYLVKSQRYGWIGGLSFSAAAWQVSNRDQWIGWNPAQRRANLKYVLCNSRMLILPSVRVPHLASHLLGRCCRQIGKDFAERYGYRPVLLESFVESGRFAGTSYRAANWHEVGLTKGRGRQDRDKKAQLPLKRVFLYPLISQWRELLCDGAELVSEPLPEPITKPKDWVEAELGRADLGDKRLTKRLAELTRSFYAQPTSRLPQACRSRAKTKAAYRFFDNEQVQMHKILKSHYEATMRRVAQHPVVLAVQDTTSLNYTSHGHTEGLGPINTQSNQAVGLELHDTLAITPSGVPLGLLDIQCWARDPEDQGKRATRRQRAIEDKESFKWIKSYRALRHWQQQCPESQLVSVGDRESDIYELFVEAHRSESGPKLLIRSERSRGRKEAEGKLWEILEKEAIAGYQELWVPRQRNRKARVAHLEIRWREVELQAPKGKKHLGEVKVWAVYAREIDAGAEVKEPLEWMLLTDVEVGSFEQACERLSWYAKRWGIEVYHRTLKSGCKIEDRQLGQASRIESCLAIDLIVAWRIYYLTKQGRETPDVPCTVFFEESEWKALVCFVNKDAKPVKEIPSLREAMRMVASLGGFLGRKCDGEPGAQTLWRGIQRLDDITATWVTCMRGHNTEMYTVYAQSGYG